MRIRNHVCNILYLIHGSGCVTSAESVLITEQSQEELYRILQENEALVKVCYHHEHVCNPDHL